MDTVQQFKKLVDSLKDINLSKTTKLQNYLQLRDLLNNTSTKEDVMKTDALRCLLGCIKLDVVSDSSVLRQSVLIVLEQICKFSSRGSIVQVLTDFCMQIIYDDLTKCGDDVRPVVFKCLQYVLQQLILQNDCDPEELLVKVNKEANKTQIVELFEKICNDIPIQQSLSFFYEKVVPAMFNTSYVDVRSCLVDFLLASLPKFEASALNPDKLEKLKYTTKKIYVEKTVQLLEADDPNWNKVWIFLVRCHGKRLHAHSDIMNALLKVVEFAFRSKIVNNSSSAYDCWRELIDIYSLDLDQMCSSKYMKLLLLPLRNNALKNANITKKRFDLWVHLISILQEKSYVLCIRQFLEFCFGPLGENPLITRGVPNIGSPARIQPELWLLSAQTLLEIMGHSEHDNCMDNKNNSLTKLKKPLVTPKNFKDLDYIIINSIGECCALMLNEMNKDCSKHLYITAISCLWNSLFDIIEQLETQDQDNAIRRVTALLAVYVELSDETPNNFQYILKPVLELLLHKKFYNIDIPRFNTQLLFPLLKRFLKHNDDIFLSGKSTILELVSYSKNTPNKSNWLEEAFEIFLKTDTKKTNVKGLLTFWIECVDVLNNVCEFPITQTKKIVQAVGLGFMMWPVLHMHQVPVTEQIIIKDVCVRWNNTFTVLLKTYTKESLTILMNIRESIESSPCIVGCVAQLFPGFKPLLDTEPNHKFVITLVHLTLTLLGVPEVTKDVKTFLLPTVLLIMNYFTVEIEKLKYSDFQNLCQCLELILNLHKDYSILKTLNNFFEKIPESFQENMPESFRIIVDDLKSHSNAVIAYNAQKLSMKFIKNPVESSPKETFLQPKLIQSSRAAKITNMAITSTNNSEGTTVLRLLGHKVESPSPVRVRGSQIEGSNKSKKRKAANIFPESKKSKVNIDDEEASYVLIDEKYQFDPNKLSEHQKEVMKKRRSDIPALYQDLSQSLSNSQSFMKNITDKTETANEDKTVDKVGPVLEKSVREEKITSEELFHTEEDNIITAARKDKEIESELISAQNKSVVVQENEIKCLKVNFPPKIEELVPVETIKPISVPNEPTTHGRSSKKLNKTSDKSENSLSSLEEKIEEPIKELNQSEGSRIDLKIQNPSMKKIESMIAESSSDYNQGFLSVLVNENSQENNDQNKSNEENKNQKIILEEKRKRKDHYKIKIDKVVEVKKPRLLEEKRIQKINKELKKIKMDIVGGEKYFQNIDLTEKIRTRRSTDISCNLRSGSKISYDSDDYSSGSESNRKPKLRATVKIIDKVSKLSPKTKSRHSPTKSNVKTHTEPVKNSTVQRKLNLDDEKTVLPKEPIRTRRRSIALDEPEPEQLKKSKSVSLPENISSQTVTHNRKKSRKDRNWIAKVNKSLQDCAKLSSKVGARKSLANVLEVASKEKPTKSHSEYTVTLVGTQESQNSEDIIESSQESCVEIKPCQTLDKSLDAIKKSIDLQIETVVTQIRSENLHHSDAVEFIIENKEELLSSTTNTETESISQKANNKILESFNPDELMRIDLTSHIQSKNNTCDMDTETLELLSETPTKLKIPTSPIASDTPIRTSELITNTLNISPIKIEPKIIKDPDSQKTPDLFDSEPCTSNKIATLKENNEIKFPSPPEIDSVPYQEQATHPCSAISDKTNQRSLKLLNMLAFTPPLENHKVQKVKQSTPKPYILSPKTHRIVKIMKTFENKSEVQEEDEEPKKLVLEKDVLKFVKALPSPMASPGNSILKRRAPDSRDEGLSPPRKKRVNFSDPPTTCEKVFFKDKNEHSYSKKDYCNEVSGSENSTNTQPVVKDVSTTSTDVPILEELELKEPPTLEAVQDIIALISNNSEKEPNTEKETQSLGLETQGSVDVADPYSLDCNQPILPEFIDSKDSIDCVLEKLANPLFCFTLAHELEKKYIFTIGDLAKLSEVEVTRLPFKTPKVLTVRTIITKHMSEKNIEASKVESKPNNVVEDTSKIEEKSNEEENKTKEPQQQTDNELSPTSSSKVKIVSSIVILPARTVSENSPKVEKSPRRVPLINVTSLNIPTCTFVETKPVVEIEPSTSKQSDIAVIFGNVEEREKLRIRIPELIADFQEMREKVKRQGLSTTSLYELIIEIVGTEEFVSILQGNKALSINHFVKNDGWCPLIKEILHNIGLNNTISCLCDTKNITPLKLVDGIIDHITTEQEATKRSVSLEKIAYNVLKTIPLSNVLIKFGMRRSIDALCEMNRGSEFTVEDFFQHSTFRFSPSLEEMIPSFRNINIVRLSDETMQLSSGTKKDLEIFVQKIGTVVEEPKFFDVFKNQDSTAQDIVKCIPEEKKDEVTYMLVDDLSSTKQEELVHNLCDTMSQGKRKEIAFALFDKMSADDAFLCWTNYFHKRVWPTKL